MGASYASGKRAAPLIGKLSPNSLRASKASIIPGKWAGIYQKTSLQTQNLNAFYEQKSSNKNFQETRGTIGKLKNQGNLV